MTNFDCALTIPLRPTQDGTIRVGDTRVSLETIIESYLTGDRPEDIHEGFPFIDLADIYAIIAFYLKNKEAVDRYLANQDEESQRILDRIAEIPGNAEKSQAFTEKCLELRELNAAA
jgi:uncharacterized protein (DUF433 family)